MNRSRRVRGWAAAAAVSVLTFGGAPEAAQAGTYTIDACANQDTGVAVAPPMGNGGLPDGWSYASNDPTFELYRTQCTGTSDSFIGVRNNGRPLTGGTSSDARYAQLDFAAPDYTYLGGYTVWRQFNGADRTAGRTAMLFQHMINGISLEWRHCSFDANCGLGVNGTPFAGSNAYHGDGTAAHRWKITLRALCDADCDWGDFRLYAARMQLHDDHNPVFASDPVGSLTAPAVLRGTVEASMDLTDLGGGLHDVSVLFDDQVGSTETVTTGDCDAVQRSRTVPCPLSLSSSLSVDTTDLADGSYTVRVRARDVAGNERLFTVGERSIDNIPPPVSTSVPIVTGTTWSGAIVGTDAGTWDGAGIVHAYQWQRSTGTGWEDIPGATGRSYTISGGDVGRRLRSRVTATNAEGSTVAYSYATGEVAPAPASGVPGKDGVSAPVGRDGASGQPGLPGKGGPGPTGADGRDGAPGIISPNGLNASASVKLDARFARTTKSRMTVPWGRPIPIMGRIVSPSGRPVIGAKVEVLARASTVGGTFKPATNVVTNEKGDFRYLAPRGLSRTVRFAYRAHLEDSTFAQTSDVTIVVRPRISLKSNRRSVRNKQSMKLTGKLMGAPAAARKIVEIQALDGKRWRTIATTRLKRGKFSYTYRFTRTRSAVTYQFRASVRQEAGWPFGTGQSNVARVKVRP